MRRKIGFPRTLFYFSDGPFWEVFFTSLGFEVIYSSETNSNILEDGIRHSVTDACVPIKIFHGHIISLIDKVDCIFIPSYVSLEKGEIFCPKFLGLPDMVQASIKGLPQIIAPDIEFKYKFFSWLILCKQLSQETKTPLTSVIPAYLKAKKTGKEYKKLLHDGYLPQTAMEIFKNKKTENKQNPKGDLNIAVLGYHYQVHDACISVNLLKHLKQLGVNIWTMEMVSEAELTPYRTVMKKNHFWHFSNRVMWSLFYFINKTSLDGVIHVTAFACGPDAMVDKFMELELKERKIPFLPVIIDEHSGEAGLITRLEAFVDMIRIRGQQQ